MLKKLALIFSLLLINGQSYALIFLDGHFQLSYSSLQKMNEVISPTSTLEHDGWTLGAGIGTRAGLSFPGIKFGAVFEIDKVQFEGERQDGLVVNAFDGAEDYDNALTRTLYGLFIGVDIPNLPIRVVGEYYPEISAKVTYAEPIGENPFAQDDKLKGKGFAAGINYHRDNEKYHATVMVRHISYDEFTLLGVETSLPNNQFEKLDAFELSLQFAFEVNLL